MIDDTDSDPVSSISNDNCIHNINLKCQTINNPGKNIPTSTCTSDTCTTRTLYKYCTSTNNNNITTTRACTCTSDNFNNIHNNINTTHAPTSDDFNNINNKDFGSRVKNINTVEVNLGKSGPLSKYQLGKSGPISKSQLTTTIPTNNDFSPLNIYQDTCTTNNCSRSRGSNRSNTCTTNNCSHSHSNSSNKINNSTIQSTENVSNNNSNTYYQGRPANDNNKGDSPILHATNTTTNTNKFYPHCDNPDPLQSNKPQIQIIGIIIDIRDKENNIEDRNDDDSYDKDGIYDDGELWGYKDSNDDDNNHSHYEK